MYHDLIYALRRLFLVLGGEWFREMGSKGRKTFYETNIISRFKNC